MERKREHQQQDVRIVWYGLCSLFLWRPVGLSNVNIPVECSISCCCSASASSSCSCPRTVPALCNRTSYTLHAVPVQADVCVPQQCLTRTIPEKRASSKGQESASCIQSITSGTFPAPTVSHTTVVQRTGIDTANQPLLLRLLLLLPQTPPPPHYHHLFTTTTTLPPSFSTHIICAPPQGPHE